MFSILKRAFGDPEKIALEIIAKDKKIITKLGGGEKVIRDFLDKNFIGNPVNRTLLSVGLLPEDIIINRSILRLSALDVLCDVRHQSILEGISSYLVEMDRKEDDSDTTILEELIRAKKYHNSDLYELAKFAFRIAYQVVTPSDVKVAKKENWAKEVGRVGSNVSLLESSGRDALSIILGSILKEPIIANDDTKILFSYTNQIETKKLEHLLFWRSSCNMRREIGIKAFNEWDNINLGTLKKLAKD